MFHLPFAFGFRFDLLHGRKCRLLSHLHVYVLADVECIFRAKFFSLGNLSLLTNFFYSKSDACSNYNYLL